jgi:hypothetical protein
MGDPPVVSRVADDSVRLHLRTIFDHDFPVLALAVAAAVAVGPDQRPGELGRPRGDQAL